MEIRTYILKIGNGSFTIGHEAWKKWKVKGQGEAVLVYFNFIKKKSVITLDSIRPQLSKHLIIEEVCKIFGDIKSDIIDNVGD